MMSQHLRQLHLGIFLSSVTYRTWFACSSVHVCNEEFEHLFGANTATDQQMLQKAFDAVDKNKAGPGSERKYFKDKAGPFFPTIRHCSEVPLRCKWQTRPVRDSCSFS